MTIGSNILFFDTLASTNNHAAFLLKNSKIAEGTIIYTNFQSAGRGQMGNTWESENGKNLLISIIFYPSMINPAGQFLISMAISLGISDFIKRFIPSCTIKWPNDIYVNNDKIAGILIENSLMGDKIEYSVAGIGLNINQKRFAGTAPNPVSLSLLTGREFDLIDCLKILAEEIDRRYTQLISEKYDLLRREYITSLYRLNEWSRYSDNEGFFIGRIIHVSDNGRLQIEKESGEMAEYSFKEVDFIL